MQEELDRAVLADATAEEAYRALFEWIERHGYRGYDPYDGCNTRYEWLSGNWHVRLVLTYLHKFSPVNLRPLFGVGKRLNAQGLALIGSSLLRRPPSRHLNIEALARGHVEYILSRSLVHRYGYHCWNGNDMYVQTRKEYQTPDMPGVIGTDACARLILDYARRYPGQSGYASVVRSVRDFLLNVLFQQYEQASFFRYKPMNEPHDCVYNASIIAANFVFTANQYLAETDGNEQAEAAFRFVLAQQQGQGYWNYARDLRTGRERHQVDYHQGFILDALVDYLDLHGDAAEVHEAYRRGLRYYRNEQFTDDGQGLYRHPRLWPANIHNQAQGIITFARAARWEDDYLGFARTVLDWTLRFMRDPRGYFYYLKYPVFTNQIPYMRWGQAWMMNALSHLLDAES